MTWMLPVTVMNRSPIGAALTMSMTSKPSIAASRARIGSTSVTITWGAQSLGPHRHALAAPAVAGDNHTLSGDQHIGGADDAVDGALTGAVAVVEEVLGHRVVDGNDGQFQDTVLLHRPEPDDARGRLFHARDHVADQARSLIGAQRAGPSANLFVDVLEPVQGNEDHRADEVGAVVHRDVRLMLEGGGDMPVVACFVLALDRVDRDVKVVDQAGRDVVLGRQRVGGDEDEVSAAGLEGPGQVGRLGRHMQASGQRRPASGFSISNRSLIARSTGMSRSAQRIRWSRRPPGQHSSHHQQPWSPSGILP